MPSFITLPGFLEEEGGPKAPLSRFDVCMISLPERSIILLPSSIPFPSSKIAPTITFSASLKPPPTPTFDFTSLPTTSNVEVVGERGEENNADRRRKLMEHVATARNSSTPSSHTPSKTNLSTLFLSAPFLFFFLLLPSPSSMVVVEVLPAAALDFLNVKDKSCSLRLGECDKSKEVKTPNNNG
eukprot:CAMPEP_0118648528 /NCGR_PEP_ID=MMETSP0785-20121206/9204_1 /TAXON_ID=91992 /ORGANISM="Bolidomonas pacifica, Strain CCMP 1866" /LENGTH=183 /DNA_ID=CAMNT_0006540727 /DNA_START=44 /DNA_END=595 /DNA_ORIENTATION=-